MSLASFINDLNAERKQRKINNMKQIIPYIQGLYNIKKNQEIADLESLKRQNDFEDWQKKEDYKLENNLFLKNVESNNRWNENNLKRQNDREDFIFEENLKNSNYQNNLKLKDALDDKNETKKPDQKNSEKIEKMKYLIEKGKLRNFTDNSGNTRSYVELDGIKYDINSEVGKEYQKAKADYPFYKNKENISNNSIEDLLKTTNQYKFKHNISAVEVKDNEYYISGKKFKGDKTELSKEIKAYNQSLSAFNKLSSLYDFEIQGDKFNYLTLWETQKEELKRKYPHLSELELKKRMYNELIKNYKHTRKPRID